MTPNEIYDTRQEQILQAALSLIADQGADSVSMNSVANLTGLSRPAIYQYFSSREHVLAEVVINEIADLSNAIDEKLAQHSSPLEQIRVWIHYSLAHLASPEHRAIAEISMQSLPAESQRMIQAMHGHLLTALLSPIVEIGIKDAPATAHLIFASVSASAKRIKDGGDFAKEAAALEKFTIAGISGALRE